MDGTLVDSMGYWKRLAGEYLETHGVLNPPKDILEKIKPMTMTDSAALFIREGVSDPAERQRRAYVCGIRYCRTADGSMPVPPGCQGEF